MKKSSQPVKTGLPLAGFSSILGRSKKKLFPLTNEIISKYTKKDKQLSDNAKTVTAVEIAKTQETSTPVSERRDKKVTSNLPNIDAVSSIVIGKYKPSKH